MSLRKLLTTPVLVQTMGVPTVDEYGNAVPGPVGDPVQELGYLDQQSTIEYLVDRDLIVSKWTAFLLPTSTVTRFSRVTFGGLTFEVNGEPYHATNPRNRNDSHIEAPLTVMT